MTIIKDLFPSQVGKKPLCIINTARNTYHLWTILLLQIAKLSLSNFSLEIFPKDIT